MSIAPVVASAVLVLAALSAFTDARSGRIPNLLTLPAFAVAMIAHVIASGATGLAFFASGVVVCGAIPVLLFHRRAMGGGDVKLFAALGAALGPTLGLEVQAVAYVAAALYSAALLLRAGALARVIGSAVRLVVSPRGSVLSESSGEPPRAVRLGVFVLVASALCLGRSALGLR